MLGARRCHSQGGRLVLWGVDDPSIKALMMRVFVVGATGATGAVLMAEIRGTSNAKATRELGWQPRYPSWRQGFAA